MLACTAEEARSRYPEAERIEGTMSLRDELGAVSSSPAHCAEVDGHPLGLNEKNENEPCGLALPDAGQAN